jgi:hypothetical protein
VAVQEANDSNAYFKIHGHTEINHQKVFPSKNGFKTFFRPNTEIGPEGKFWRHF